MDGRVVWERLDEFPGGALREIDLGLLDGGAVSVAEVTAGDERFVSLRAALMVSDEGTFPLLSFASQLLHFHKTHLFCGRCGAQTVAKDNDRARTCKSCLLEVYPRVSPAMIVLVEKGDELLLAHRPTAPVSALVAGFVESGETLEQCVAREVMEEVGLEVSDLRYFGSQPWPFPHQLMVGFFARWARGDIRVDGIELDAAQWFKRGALPPVPPPLSIARSMIDAFVAGQSPPTRL